VFQHFGLPFISTIVFTFLKVRNNPQDGGVVKGMEMK